MNSCFPKPIDRRRTSFSPFFSFPFHPLFPFKLLTTLHIQRSKFRDQYFSSVRFSERKMSCSPSSCLVVKMRAHRQDCYSRDSGAGCEHSSEPATADAAPSLLWILSIVSLAAAAEAAADGSTAAAAGEARSVCDESRDEEEEDCCCCCCCFCS